MTQATTPYSRTTESRRRSHARRRRGQTVAISVNLTPMIDVTFLLLIFFLVTTSFERPEGLLRAQLPKDAGVPTVALPISPIVLRVLSTGSGFDDFVIRIDRFGDVPSDFNVLADYLRDIQNKPGFDDDTPVVIKAGDEVRWDHVVNSWNAAVRAGFRNIAFSAT